jgi:hypothetical protein
VRDTAACVLSEFVNAERRPGAVYMSRTSIAAKDKTRPGMPEASCSGCGRFSVSYLSTVQPLMKAFRGLRGAGGGNFDLLFWSLRDQTNVAERVVLAVPALLIYFLDTSVRPGCCSRSYLWPLTASPPETSPMMILEEYSWKSKAITELIPPPPP